MQARDKRRKSYRWGLAAEKLAGWYLRCKGYRVVAERYRNHMGEIDIVACRGNTLVAVEVKARKSMEACEESITPLKQQRVARAVQSRFHRLDLDANGIRGLLVRDPLHID